MGRYIIRLGAYPATPQPPNASPWTLKCRGTQLGRVHLTASFHVEDKMGRTKPVFCIISSHKERPVSVLARQGAYIQPRLVGWPSAAREDTGGYLQRRSE